MADLPTAAETDVTAGPNSTGGGLMPPPVEFAGDAYAAAAANAERISLQFRQQIAVEQGNAVG